MRRKIWMILLGIGAIAGFAWGFHSLHHFRGAYGPGSGRWGARHAEFEAHVADICTRAAERTLRERDALAPRPLPPP